MCLSRLVRIAEVTADGTAAVGDEEGRRVEVSLAVLALGGDTLRPGDWVLVTTGLAVRRLSPTEAADIKAARAALFADR